MIKVIFYKDSHDDYTGFELKGHAGFAEYGQDIVCAAVSALTINTVNSIEKFTDDTFQSVEEEGLVAIKFSSKIGDKTTLLLDSLLLGLTGICDEHVECLSVKIKKIRRWEL